MYDKLVATSCSRDSNIGGKTYANTVNDFSDLVTTLLFFNKIKLCVKEQVRINLFKYL